MTRVEAVEPEPGIGDVLAGADFIDAYRLSVAATGLDAAEVARSILARPPAWILGLLALRNMLVAPFGLKTGLGAGDHHGAIGWFPVVAMARSRVVLGFDDKHLDFRLVVDVAEAGARSTVTATTLVRRNNLLGRAYLATILPFHKVIVPALLKRAAAR